MNMLWSLNRYLAYFSLILCGTLGSDPEQVAFKSPGKNFFSQQPPPNSTDNLIFNSVSSLLQKWSNTRYRNGHTIVPAEVPIGTLLYHGTSNNEIPPEPDWVATDPEHSFSFCRSVLEDSGCWHLTLITTRPLQILYFDGNSAAKMSDGVMDIQDLLVWDRVMPNKTLEEGERIGRLCEWGKQYKLDGFLRMAINFEIMLCDFSAGVKVVSFLNIAAADNARHKRLLQSYPHSPRIPKTFPLRLSTAYRVLESGTWHNHFPGETRIRIDYSRLISFYDTTLFPGLHTSRLGKARQAHRLNQTPTEEIRIFKTRLEEVLTHGLGTSQSDSGIDWKTLLNVIMDRYAERLELLHYILNSTIHEPGHNATLKQAHRQVSSMIAPYIVWSSVSRLDSRTPADDYSWAMPVFDHCSTTHTKDIETLYVFGLSHSEQLIVNSIKGISREICRVLINIWSEGVLAGFDEPDLELPSLQKETLPSDMIYRWKASVEILMAWLDWSYWIRCRPACGYEEMCYIPMWPFFLTEEEKMEPQPKCIRRIESLEFKT